MRDDVDMSEQAAGILLRHLNALEWNQSIVSFDKLKYLLQKLHFGYFGSYWELGSYTKNSVLPKVHNVVKVIYSRFVKYESLFKWQHKLTTFTNTIILLWSLLWEHILHKSVLCGCMYMIINMIVNNNKKGCSSICGSILIPVWAYEGK